MVQRTKERLAHHCGFQILTCGPKVYFGLIFRTPKISGIANRISRKRKCEKINFSSLDYEIISSTNCLWFGDNCRNDGKERTNPGSY